MLADEFRFVPEPVSQDFACDPDRETLRIRFEMFLDFLRERYGPYETES